jgi:hypothetical protein
LINDLLYALEASDVAAASERFRDELERGADPWKVHLALFPLVQRVLNLHRTITLYAMERVCQFFSKEEYNHMIGSWIAFMGGKSAKPITFDRKGMEPLSDYARFYETFSTLEAKPVVASMEGMILSPEGRRQLGRSLIKGLCDQYQGNYNPHYLTGLGSALWVVDRYWNQAQIVMNALFQYIDFFFKGIKS